MNCRVGWMMCVWYCVICVRCDVLIRVLVIGVVWLSVVLMGWLNVVNVVSIVGFVNFFVVMFVMLCLLVVVFDLSGVIDGVVMIMLVVLLLVGMVVGNNMLLVLVCDVKGMIGLGVLLFEL